MTILVTIPVMEHHKVLFQKNAPDATFIYQQSLKVTQEEIAEVEIIIGNIPVDMLIHASKLKWLQLNSAGSDDYVKKGVLPRGTLLTNATGAYGLAISEHMLGMLLELQKKLHLYLENQNNHLWQDAGDVTSIYGSTAVIVGMGDIGSEFAKRLKALGSYTIGIRRTSSIKPEFVDELYTTNDLAHVIGQADIVALSLPNTKETYHLLDADLLAKMKKGALLINVGRGNAIDQEALLEALNSEHLGGAGLDVTDPEPLPGNNPLWDAKNIVITPHVSGAYHLQETLERIIRIASNNMQAYMTGEPLMNLVDFETGYRKRD